VLRRRKADLLVLSGYAAISFAYFGWRLLPHPGRGVIGFGHDPEIYIWSFAWWPHALGSLMNPFFSHALYAPTGVNLAWTLTVPGLALAFSPLTVLFGPAVSYNIAALLMPALAAWTAYFLCRHLTRSFWASLVGGYLFGFSAAVLRPLLFGNLPVNSVFLLPLVALVLVRYVQGELGARGLAWRLGVLLAAQFWLSTEFALTVTVVLALGLLLAFWLVRELRPRLRSSLVPIAAGYGLGALFAAPLVAYALIGFHTGSFVDLQGTGSDLLNFVVPLRGIALGGSSLTSLSAHLPNHGATAYLGLPVLLIVAAFAARARRAAGPRFLVAALGVTALIVLGTELQVDGRTLIALPWSLAGHVPVLKSALPLRFAAYVALTAAVIVALWTASTKGRIYARPYLLPSLAVAALVPAIWQSAFPSFRPQHPERLAFFTDGLYRTCIPNETVAIFPFGFGGDSLLWQAEAGFRFRLASDGLQAPTRTAKPLNSFDADPIVRAINFDDFARPTMDSLLAFAALHHVDRILVAPSSGYPSRTQLSAIGPTQLVGGMLVAPACGQPSLAARDLTSFVEQLHQAAGKSIGYCTGVNFNLIPQGLYPAGTLKSATPANFVAGRGLTCLPPPAGYKHHGFATADMSVPANTYPYYAP
jgi:hypothetical protein